MCNICSINSRAVRNRIEQYLAESGGFLSIDTKESLIKEFPEFEAAIYKITAKDCEIHYGFHQSIVAALPRDMLELDETLAKDVGKTEAEILYQLLCQQAATMTALTNKINDQLQLLDGPLNGLFINPATADFYDRLGDSMRRTVEQIDKMNMNLNGKKDGALDGLMALAKALHGNDSDAEQSGQLTTTEYD